MKFLVTGGAGFIGSHLTGRLLNLQHEVAVIDNFDPFYDPQVKERNLAEVKKHAGFHLYRQDLLNNSFLP